MTIKRKSPAKLKLARSKIIYQSPNGRHSIETKEERIARKRKAAEALFGIWADKPDSFFEDK